MSGSINFPPAPPAVDLSNGAGSANAAVYLTMLAAQLAQDDGALAFSILATAAAICGAVNGHQSDDMINQFAACMPIGRDIFMDMTAEDDEPEGDIE